MTDRPILFSGPMVRALLEGRKTQTRRVAKLPGNPTAYLGMNGAGDHVFPSEGTWGGQWRSPYAVGDQLWVREAWHTSQAYEDLPPREMSGEEPMLYAADDRLRTNGWSSADWRQGRFRAGMHMPRWASRLTLTVTEVRVQRVQEISYLDTCAEGVECVTCAAMGQSACYRKGCGASREAFRDLWDSLNAPRGYGWNANPWVAAYTFTVERRNIDGARDAGA